ncbi:MAG: ABC transporter ATP-binding protein [Spirochaetia bacterium]|nr:ABC transporter ATP-binding protein [Spirochaetia bacterium]
MLKLGNIGFTYGINGFKLHDFSLEIRQGDFAALAGPNGAGKSTVMKILAGITGGYTGAATASGTDMKKMDPAVLARIISYVPQSDSLAFDYSVEQIVSMGRRPHTGPLGVMSQNDRTAVDAAMEEFGLYRKRARLYNSLSGGEKRMALIARAVAQDSSVMLMDEPTSSLDIQHQEKLMEKLCGLHAAGRTVLMISHGINLTSEYFDRVILMKDGIIAADGSPADVITSDKLKEIYGIENFVVENNPLTGRPNIFLIPGRKSNIK